MFLTGPESLLFHGLAALDRLSECIADEYGFKQSKPVFFAHLKTRVENNVSDSDTRKQCILSHIYRANQHLSGVLTIAPGETASLRTHLIHYSSFSESSVSAFCIQPLQNGKRLFFDCEAMGEPVLKTSHTLCQVIPYLVLNLVGLYVDARSPAVFETFYPNWINPTVVLNEYLCEEGQGIRVPVVRLTPAGFQWCCKNVRLEIIEKAI